jgi:hypothetical protein
MRRSLAVLRCTSRIIDALLRRASGQSRIAERWTARKFRAALEKAAGEFDALRFFLGFIFSRNLSLQSGKAVEEELGNVGQGNGVAAGDAFARELFDKIAEEEIHGLGGGEVIDLAEKVGGEEFRVDSGNGGSETIGVVGAERRARGSVRETMMIVDQHVAAIAFRADVLAVVIEGGAG